MSFITRIVGNPKLKHQLQQHRPVLYRTARAWTGDDMLADDLVQDTLGNGLKKLHQLQDESKMLPWLFTILNNQWRQHLRSMKQHVDIDTLELVDSHCPEKATTQYRTAQKVRSAVQSLPMNHREVVSLVDLNDFSYKEVAQILDVPVGTVMSRLSRARQTLLMILQDEADDADRPVRLRSVK